MSDLTFKPAVELAQLIRDRQIGCLELLDDYLDRMEQYNPQIKAIAVQDVERARERARQADAALARGEVWGPLHGVPMTCKESFDLAGLPTTFGSPLLKYNIAAEDALAIQRLKAAGAVVFGKTNVPLWLADFQSYNVLYGITRNPWDLQRTPGGSSGGSAAALASGMTALEIGSDIGGSIRNPAHFCGVFGHKPTWGLLPARGHSLPGILRQMDLAVIGPLARSAADLELGLQTTAGPDELRRGGFRFDLQPSSQKSLSDYRVAVWKNDDTAPVSREVAGKVEAVAQAIAGSGGTVDETARPDFVARQAHDTYELLLAAVLGSFLPEGDYAWAQADAAGLSVDDDSERARWLRRRTASYWEYAQADEARTHLRWAWHEFFKTHDALIAPIMATPAFEHDFQPFEYRTLEVDGVEQPYRQQIFWAGLAVCAYLPSTVVPAGLGDDDLPIGVQIIGPEFGDLKTIGLAKLLEGAGFAFTPPPGYC